MRPGSSEQESTVRAQAAFGTRSEWRMPCDAGSSNAA
jgi:hypothetical protein